MLQLWWKKDFNFHDPKVLYCLGCNFISGVKPHAASPNSVSMPPQHGSCYSDNKKASVIFCKIGCVSLICPWLPPWKTSFWLSNERLKNKKKGKRGENRVSVAERDKKKEPYSECVSHCPHILLFVWCRYWFSSEKSGLHSAKNGSVRLVKWNRNVIWNQCIPASPGHLNNGTSPFFFFFFYVSLSLQVTLFLCEPPPSPSKPRAVWKMKGGIGPKCFRCVCRPLTPPWT